MFLTPIYRAAATATVRTVKRKRMIPMRAALTLVSLYVLYECVGKITVWHWNLLIYHTQTPAAVNRVKELIEDKPDCVGLKIGVKTRGCNGLSYILDYAFEKNRMDEEVTQDGIKIFIDKKAQLTLLGTEMDFQETKLAAEFVFNNPNITGTCGCGESFSV